MTFSYDPAKAEAAIAVTRAMPGISLVRVWLNAGELKPGDDIMYVLIGGDIRPRVMEALDFLVGRIKSECVVEKEIY
jgi:molybdopterin synthase catalytic subunit